MTLSFQPLAKAHFSLMLKWLELPHVKQFWDSSIPWTIESIQEKYSSYVEGYKLVSGQRKSLKAFIICFDEHPIGYIQTYDAYDFPRQGYDLKEKLKDTSASSLSLAALDLFIGEKEIVKQGIGALAIAAFLKTYVWPQFDACLVDPDKNNLSAIKAYAKSGFTTHHDLGASVLLLARKEPPEKNPIVIFGSSRSQGDTLQAINTIVQDRPVPIVDLREQKISYYDYAYANANDDFLPLAEKMTQHNPIILATPVYWYTMSAIMKTFIDRWSDLIDLRKDIGRRFIGKDLYIITSYAGDIPRGFEDAFAQTCEYMEMHYKGCLYFYSGEDAELLKENARLAEQFAQKLWELAPSQQPASV